MDDVFTKLFGDVSRPTTDNVLADALGRELQVATDALRSIVAGHGYRSENPREDVVALLDQLRQKRDAAATLYEQQAARIHAACNRYDRVKQMLDEAVQSHDPHAPGPERGE